MDRGKAVLSFSKVYPCGRIGESVVRPVVDYVLTRPEVDPERLAIAGWSFGGYLALRGRAVNLD
ncbi:alpha/beta hydrolase family protein [Synechococcus elongatus]|uniref:alpha/beta hydrolase family protein n=1 Tax=Synechococcus elongatus TaxID=32046 RepID=UPI0030CDCFD4